MTLPVLILVAIVIPVALIGGLWFLARTTTWLGSRPRAAAIATMLFGLIYIALGVAQWSESRHWSDLLFAIIGLFAIGNGVYRWRHPVAVSFE